MGRMIAVLMLMLPFAAPAAAQTRPVADVVASGDLGALQAAAGDAALLDQLRQTDPDGLIALQLALAEAWGRSGLIADAIAAYETALLSILQFRGQGHISMADPMTAVGRLTDDLDTKLDWLESAQRIREAHWGVGDPRLDGWRMEIEAVRTALSLRRAD